MKKYLWILIIIVLLTACGKATPPGDPPEQEEVKGEVAQVAAPTPAPTDTPVLIDTPIPTLSKEEALRKWRAPFVAAAFAYTLCMQASETPEGVAPLDFIMILGVSAGTLEQWAPEPDQVGIEQALKAAIQEFNKIFQDNNQTTFPAAAAEICPAFLGIVNDIRGAVKADGLTDEDLQAVIKEVQESLKQVLVVTPEPTATQTSGPTEKE